MCICKVPQSIVKQGNIVPCTIVPMKHCKARVVLWVMGSSSKISTSKMASLFQILANVCRNCLWLLLLTSMRTCTYGQYEIMSWELFKMGTLVSVNRVCE